MDSNISPTQGLRRISSLFEVRQTPLYMVVYSVKLVVYSGHLSSIMSPFAYLILVICNLMRFLSMDWAHFWIFSNLERSCIILLNELMQMRYLYTRNLV